MNIWDILILLLAAGAVILAVRHIRRKPGCGGSCQGCSCDCACRDAEKRE